MWPRHPESPATRSLCEAPASWPLPGVYPGPPGSGSRPRSHEQQQCVEQGRRGRQVAVRVQTEAGAPGAGLPSALSQTTGVTAARAAAPSLRPAPNTGSL